MITKRDSDYEYCFDDVSKKATGRINSLFEKEEGTIDWIRSFDKDTVFFDVGANIGLYTIFAAKRVGAVFAFEPHIGNYRTLVNNVALNKAENVEIQQVGVGSTNCEVPFYYSSEEVGAANNQLNTIYDGDGDKLEYVKVEQVKCITLDSLGIQPNYVKIDVDGLEIEVLRGMTRILKNTKLASVLVEYNPMQGYLVEGFMAEYNFTLLEHQLTHTGKKRHKAGEEIDNIPHNHLYVRA